MQMKKICSVIDNKKIVNGFAKRILKVVELELAMTLRRYTSNCHCQKHCRITF